MICRLIVRVILPIMRFYPHLISTVRVRVRLDISMPVQALQPPQVQVMQMRVVAHRLHRGVKADVVAPVQRPKLVTQLHNHVLGDAETDIGTVGSLSVVNFHLDQHVCRMVVEGQRIVFVEVDTDDVALPGDAPAEEMRVELAFRALR